MQLSLLKKMAHGMAQQFGPDCEIVIHDVSLLHSGNTIVHVENGHVSSRKVGDGPTHPVLEALQKGGEGLEDRYGYLTKTADGRLFKSTTIFVPDKDGKPAYIFCLNLDVTKLVNMQEEIEHFLHSGRDSGKESYQKPEAAEVITTNVIELLDDLLLQCEKRIGKDALRMSKEERIKAVHFLNDSGAFLISKSVDRVADYFGVSKFTVYNDLNSVAHMSDVG